MERISPPPTRRRRLPWISIAVALGAVAVYFTPAWETQLVYERAEIIRGQFWRLWTGNWVHFGLSHLVWNLIVLVPTGVWLERIAPFQAKVFFVAAPGLIGLALLTLDPTLAYYGGLSGVAAGALTLLAAIQIARSPGDRWFWGFVLAMLAAKIALESSGGSALFARFRDPGVRPVPLAHVAGMVCGAGVWFRLRRI